MKIPITKPYFGEEERQAVLKPLDSGWVVQGPFVREFEAKFCSFIGSGFAAASSSCTSALHLAMAALGLKPGDEVIVPAFTWVATANVVEYMGARPIFCDVDLRTFNLDAEAVESLVTSRTVGILPVHLFGLCASMEPLLALSRRRKLWVVEDAACALGGRIGGVHAGTFGDLGCFSFHPRKSITTGEGGMVTTGRGELDRLVRCLRDHGASSSDLDRHTATRGFLLAEYAHLGYNYRMTDLQAAVGSAQMDRARWILGERGRRARRYDERLSHLSWLKTPWVPPGFDHGYQAYVCLFCPEEPSLVNAAKLHSRRNEVMSRLEAKGIATRQGTHAAALQTYYSAKYGLKPESFPQSFLADRLSIALPLFPQMTDEEQDFVVREFQFAFESA